MPNEAMLIAVDLGATSGRVIAGTVTANSVELRQTSRFANAPVTIWEGTTPARHWSILDLYRGAIEGLRTAVREAAAANVSVASIGVDSWGVDYGRLSNGRMRDIPYHYRDERTTAGVAAAHALMPHAELYAINGLQHLPINTVYQLMADLEAGNLEGIDSILQIPDLFNYWLTGVQRAETTNASTTGLLDIRTREWSRPLVERLGLPFGMLPQLSTPGETIGSLLPSVTDEIGAASSVPVVSVGSHDTASAVVAIPSTSHDFAYISSGTWSLVGLELDAPVLTEASRKANFTNEAGVDNTVRYLKNVMGMWLLSECLGEWERAGTPQDLVSLLREAETVSGAAVFDVDHPELLPAGPMTRRIAARCDEAGQPIPSTPAEFVRSIVESLAAAYAVHINDACELSGSSVSSIHIVGGGSQNALLCQLTANQTGLPVIAGPVEGTAMGNVLVQARSAGIVSGDVETLRAIVSASTQLTRYEPQR
ncbi:rhamnulokinase [Lysinibacter cavernae]|uniref:Rhamnulokinase n=1 Tax=Lysinibacter cavernae TaxID=1640652 RepID=A0A7X5R1T7_9MICO|nr:rhamnulokinase family protein [Lysinibacter cavernae]NIH54031.1 rhamnulokinase [Lysinibacter cavernae]